MTPKVSVIIPNYNHAEFLEQRINSVLNQTFDHFEIIILDDFSTDQSKSVIEKFRLNSKVIHVVYNDANTGNTFLQWKKGIELARGEWIWIAESDDYCEDSLLVELLDGAAGIEGCTLSYCQSVMFQENSILWISNSDHLKKYMKGRNFVQEYMLKGNSVFNASMCIFRKEKYYSVQQEFTKYKYSGDWLFWIEIALQGHVFISGKTLNYFRKHLDDVSLSAFNAGIGYIDYFPILHYLEAEHSLIGKRSITLLYEKFKQFLCDNRVAHPSRKEIQSLFKQALKHHYYFAFGWLAFFEFKRLVRNSLLYKLKQVND